MVNSIGLPNKGLDGFLADDLPELAELPVPLIVSVMATSVEEFGPAGRRRRRARRGRRARAQRLLPERPFRPDRRRAAVRDRVAAGGAASPDVEAADREADAERRRAGRDRARCRAGGRRRRLADQHPQGRSPARRRDAPGWARSAAGSRAPRSARSPSSRSRTWSRRSRFRSSGWAASSTVVTPRRCSPPALWPLPSAPPASGIHWPPSASAPNSPIICRSPPAGLRHSSRRSSAKRAARAGWTST